MLYFAQLGLKGVMSSSESSKSCFASLRAEQEKWAGNQTKWKPAAHRTTRGNKLVAVPHAPRT